MKKIIAGIFIAMSLMACNSGSKSNTDSLNANGVQVEGKNYTDAKGLKQGDWIITGAMQTDKSFGANAKVEEGKYMDGKKEGMWIEYYPGGAVKSKGEYSGGKKMGKWAIYDEKGVETGEAIYN